MLLCVTNSFSHGDFLLFHILDNTLLAKPEALTGHPKLEDWMARIHAIPQIKEYLQKRPGPAQVGKDGTLIRTLGDTETVFKLTS